MEHLDDWSMNDEFWRFPARSTSQCWRPSDNARPFPCAQCAGNPLSKYRTFHPLACCYATARVPSCFVLALAENAFPCHLGVLCLLPPVGRKCRMAFAEEDGRPAQSGAPPSTTLCRSAVSMIGSSKVLFLQYRFGESLFTILYAELVDSVIDVPLCSAASEPLAPSIGRSIPTLSWLRLGSRSPVYL